MKTLVVFYSRTGFTRKAADAISKRLKADSEELIDLTQRAGPVGWLTGGRDAMKKVLTKIEPLKKEPSAYDLVIIGSPVWAANMAPAVRTFLTEHKLKKKAALFCTMGSMGDKAAFDGMRELMPQATVVAEMALTSKQVAGGDLDRLDDFVEKAKTAK